jgi:protein TonB
MSYALSQRGASRHPVGLSVVIGLHVLLAAVLITAKINRTPPAGVGTIDVVPQQPIPPKQVETPLPKPNQAQPMQPQLVVPVIPDAKPDDSTPVAKAFDPNDKPLPVVAEKPTEMAKADPGPRVQAHPASINAGAAQCRPVYPAQALRSGATGVSKIRFTVDAGGKVAAAQILASSGVTREHRMLDKAAAEALAQCPIVVGTDDMGRAVGTTVDVEYVWSMN